MPSFGQTPEALLGRNDSKNPSTTCKGLTSSGRPCRRALASPKSSPLHKRKDSALGGVVAIVQEDGEDQEADFYCWQHKDQAIAKVEDVRRQGRGERPSRRSTELFHLKEKSSIDTMVVRLGLDPTADREGRRTKPTRNPRPPRATDAQDYASRPARLTAQTASYAYNDSDPPPRRKVKKTGFWAPLCCVVSEQDDYVEVVRHKKRDERNRPVGAPSPQPPLTASMPDRTSEHSLPRRPAAQPRSSSNAHTTHLLSLIPQHLSPQTTSALLMELIKPINPHDEEGYIYVFWLTPQSKAAPTEDTARSLLSPGHSSRARRVSDVMSEFSFDGSEPEKRGEKSIMLKIGRANNVTRRMNEWQRQCGYALNLVRWYPYVSSSPQPSPRREAPPLYPSLGQLTPESRGQGDGVRKVRCVKRVERLIQLELQDQQVKRQCGACGKEHREWFEVEASQAGIRGVDGCVRRWIEWAERQSNGS
ncbi:hypothetical protein LTR62_006997 [Meristemomyces frigidus]|uniref:Bacteriophage T5 Orf172 DNA-binding domain-containing protein n=1 Tax=Meristemomyces frigidus TaxID=1508187 RepID=A0AAN7TJD1_9PEZI|nr:hypothetical protein LTR62_006997 [Meristemomyces frigidus]